MPEPKRFAVIANFHGELRPRAKMFFDMVFDNPAGPLEWEYISYNDLLQKDHYARALSMDGLILSSSDFYIVDPLIQDLMAIEMKLIAEFKGPIFAMCFAHHILELMFGAEVTEHGVADFLNEQAVQYNVPKASPPTLVNFAKKGSDNPDPEKCEYIPLFDDKLKLLTPPPPCEVKAKQHLTRPIFGFDFGMDENAPDDAMKAAVVITRNFLNSFYST